MGNLTSSRDDDNDQAELETKRFRSKRESGEEDRDGRDGFEDMDERD